MDTETKANLYALEQRIFQLEQKIEHMADIGDLVEVEWPVQGDVYASTKVEIKRILKRDEE